MGKFLLLFLCVFCEPVRAEFFIGIGPGDSFNSCAEFKEGLAYVFRPGCKTTIVRSGHTSRMSYNSEGLRDKDYPPRPRKGWKRILLLGSSALAAPGLEEPVTPGRIFEKNLRKKDPRIEVINAGIEGYTTVQTGMILRGLIARYAPTHVIVYSDLSTDGFLVVVDHILNRHSDGTREKIVPFWAKVKLRLSRDFPVSPTLETLPYAAYWLFSSIKCKYFSGFTEESQAACLLSAAYRRLEILRELAEAGGAKFLMAHSEKPIKYPLIVSPDWDTRVVALVNHFVPTFSLDHKLIAKGLAKRGLVSHGMSKLNNTDPKETLLPNDFHLSEAGSKIFAEELASIMGPLL
jgi:hypothetical protein